MRTSIQQLKKYVEIQKSRKIAFFFHNPILNNKPTALAWMLITR